MVGILVEFYRVVSVIRSWVQNHYYDFTEDPKLVQDLTDFIENGLIQNKMEKAGQQLKKALSKIVSFLRD
jgi:beta-xylosidase